MSTVEHNIYSCAIVQYCAKNMNNVMLNVVQIVQEGCLNVTRSDYGKRR